MKRKMQVMMKSWLVVLMSVVVILSGISLPVYGANDTLVVHYQRPDGDYGPWNLWVWPEGGEGQVYEFTGEDAYGRIALIQTSGSASRYGFIVRTNDWDKDVADDRFMEVVDGQAEIWLLGGEGDFVTSPPQGYEAFDGNLVAPQEEVVNPVVIPEDGATVRVHYHRHDANYEGWNVWLWPENGNGAAYNFNGEDDFGPYAEVVLSGVEADGRIGVIIRLNEWEAKDVDQDRFMTVAKMGEDGVLDIWLVQSDAMIYYDVNEVDMTPKFLSASLSKLDRIEILVTVPFVLKGAAEYFTLKDQKGQEIKVKHVTTGSPTERVSQATILLEEPMVIGNSYTLSRQEYGEIKVSMTSVYDTEDFAAAYTYEGADLGAVYSQDSTTFRVWAPTNDQVILKLYEKGDGDNLKSQVTMVPDVNGTHVATVKGDLNGVYYTYEVIYEGSKVEVTDPYARTAGVNGERGMVIDLASTNPQGWDEDSQLPLGSMTDAIIYELHVRDLSTAENSGITNVGKFLGLTESGTKNEQGLATGLDHLKELGITHLHLLPSFDYRSIDESKLEDNRFNWGYDPENYNMPEGSYSTNPYEGAVRVKEFKEMVKTLHDNDIRVVMDVVYNHTGATGDSNLNLLVPDYYYRTVDGVFSNGSGCGNETASERAMVRKLMVESVVYWAKEYHVDGFRFDLMGLHDIQTMNEIRKALDQVDPSIIIYGEGWTGGSSPLPDDQKALKAHTYMMEGIAAFSDDMRDGIKGSVFVDSEKGFVNGALGMEESIKFGVVGSTKHDQIRYSEVNYSDYPWANSPAQAINYASAHDNLTLFDKLMATNPDATMDELASMSKLSNAIVLTAQGVPFIHAGEEMLRTKDMDENSYQSSDAVNQIDWQWKTDHEEVVNYFKGLVAFRKAHPALRMNETQDLVSNLRFYGSGQQYHELQMDLDQVVAYIINNHANGDEAGAIFVAYNGGSDSVQIDVPEGEWSIMINKEYAGNTVLGSVTNGQVTVEGTSALVMIKDEPVALTSPNAGQEQDSINDPGNIDSTEQETKPKTSTGVIIGIIGLIGASLLGLLGYKRYKKK